MNLVLLFLIGLVVLSAGAEFFVRGASRLARSFGISPLVIGLTVVAFGTSAPEAAVVIGAGLQGQGDMAVGNIIGSNISNFLLILGLSAMIAPLVVSSRLIQLEVPLLLGATVIVMAMAADGLFSLNDGLLLLVGAIVYTVVIVRQAMKAEAEPAASAVVDTSMKPALNAIDNKEAGITGAGTAKNTRSDLIKNVFMLLLGLAALVLGAGWLVDGASGIARSFGVSDLIIGLTIVAVGTSLPELATSIAATMRGERDLAIGNVIGSNLYNLLLVLGVGVVLTPGGFQVPSSSISFDLPVMLAITAASLPIFFSGYVISRWEGMLFFGYFTAYVLYLLLFSLEHDILPAFSTLMLQYIIPFTGIMLLFFSIRAFRHHKKQ